MAIKHKRHCIPSHGAEIEFPFCYKKYQNLDPILLHLEIRKMKKKGKWKPCECPLKPQHLTHGQTWQHLLRIYQNPIRKKLQDKIYDIRKETETEKKKKQAMTKKHPEKTEKKKTRKPTHSKTATKTQRRTRKTQKRTRT